MFQNRRPGLEILTLAPDDQSEALDWMQFQNKLVYGGTSFRLQIGPCTFQIPALTAFDLEELRKSATMGDVGAWMRSQLQPTGRISRLIARTIGIDKYIYWYADAVAVSQAAAELWKLNLAVKKKTWVIGPNDAPSSGIRKLSTDLYWNLPSDVSDFVIIGDA